jgi:hypothetical protein
MRGLDQLYLGVGSGPSQVDDEVALIEAADQESVGHRPGGVERGHQQLGWLRRLRARQPDRHPRRRGRAYAVLRDGPGKHADQSYRLDGPEALSMHDVARRLGALLGKEVSYEERTPAQEAAQLTADGLPPLVVEILLGVDESIRQEWLADSTTLVSELSGTPPRPIDQWLTEHLADFRAR